VKITAIGEITRVYDVMIVDGSGRGEPLEAGGWDPFRRLRSRKT
jgi:hypothetical protein